MIGKCDVCQKSNIEIIVHQCPIPIAFSGGYCQECSKNCSESFDWIMNSLKDDRFDGHIRERIYAANPMVTGYLNGVYIPIKDIIQIYERHVKVKKEDTV